MGGFLVFVEQQGGEPRKASLEALTAASRLASGRGDSVAAVLVGPRASSAAGALGRFGARRAFVGEGAAYERDSPDGKAAAIVAATRRADPDTILLAATITGRDVAPRAAASLRAAQASDCTDLKLEGGALRARRPVYAGKAYLLVESNTRPFVCTLRPNVFPVGENPAECAVEPLEGIAPDGGRARARRRRRGEARRRRGPDRRLRGAGAAGP
jgi:electron transfer flavoprotein alpha subunit